jgi:hypothetical protein
MIADMLLPEKLTLIYDLIQKLDLKHLKTEKEIIKLRNLRRFITLFHNHAYCPLQNREIFKDELFSCMVCENGHITECHYPHRYSSEFCDHHRAEKVSAPYRGPENRLHFEANQRHHLKADRLFGEFAII